MCKHCTRKDGTYSGSKFNSAHYEFDASIDLSDKDIEIEIVREGWDRPIVDNYYISIKFCPMCGRKL